MILMRHGESEFNVKFKKTRIDPGIRDPKLTKLGRQQVMVAISYLIREKIVRILTSPYTRALETASIVAEQISVPIEVDPLIGERAAFICDLGTPASNLRLNWPSIKLDHIEEDWWPAPIETEARLDIRCRLFKATRSARRDCSKTLVISHWGFIRGLTGHTVGNAQLVKFDPKMMDSSGVVVVPMDLPC